jgi:cleavage and polyadenylation specificity factor subunit 1
MTGSIDGSVGFFMPVNEKIFRRLHDISGEMINRLDHLAGLNPRAFRLGHHLDESVHAAPFKTILDGDFAAKFSNLPLLDRLKWSRNKGTSSDRVMNDLGVFQLGSDFF